MVFGIFVIFARSTSSTYGGIKPDAIPAIFGPYVIVTSIAYITLGILVFRQRVIAAVGLLVLMVAEDVLGYLVPMLNLDGVASYRAALEVEAISLILTAIVVIADRAARSTTG
jgi:hypothetical protein